MKKCFFSIAILAASVCLVVGCGNQSGKSACCADSTEVDENVGEAGESADNHTVALPMTRTSFEMNTFTVGVPEGWGTTPNLDPASSDIMVFKGDMEKIMTSPTMIINVDKLEDGKSLDETLKATLEAADAELDMKPIPGVMIEGKDYRAFEMTENDVKGTILYAEENGKIISVTIINSQPDNPEVLTILKSIKVK